MKITLMLSVLCLCLSARAETLVDDKADFGDHDARGAYQEVRIQPILVNPDYFEEPDQWVLKADAKEQLKYDMYQNGEHTFYY